MFNDPWLTTCDENFLLSITTPDDCREFIKYGKEFSDKVFNSSIIEEDSQRRRSLRKRKIVLKEEQEGSLPLIKEGSLLPKSWKPARGRARQYQLKSMTLEERVEEEESIREKNRLAASRSRRLKKIRVENMEEKLKKLMVLVEHQEKVITSLKKTVELLSEN